MSFSNFSTSISKIQRFILTKTGLSYGPKYDILPNIEYSDDDDTFTGLSQHDEDAYTTTTSSHKRQLVWIALCRLAEPIAATSISPYIYHYIRHLNGCNDGNVGYYVGLLSAAFAAAQFVTGFLWGSLSDKIGRKNCILLGLLGASCSHLLWGFSTNLKMAFIARLLGGSLNANVSMYKSMIGGMKEGEQGLGFAALAGVWTIGSIFGSFMGGHLAFPNKRFKSFGGKLWCRYPALLVSMVVSGLLFVAFVLAVITLREDIPDDESKKVSNLSVGSTNAIGHRRKTSKSFIQPKTLNRSFHGNLEISKSLRRPSEDYSLRTPLLSSALSPRTPLTPRTPHQQRHINARPPLPQSPLTPSSDEDESKPTPATLFQTLVFPTIFSWTISYIILTMQTASYSDLVMLFSSTPLALGGLELPQTTLSSLFAIASIISAVVQFIILYFFSPKAQVVRINSSTSSWNWTSYAIVTALLPIVAFITPIVERLSIPAISLGFMMTIQASCEAVGFSILGILVSKATPSHLLGRVNGALFSLGALARTLGPLGLSWLFAVQTASSKHSALAVWGLLSFIGVVGWIVVMAGKRSVGI